MTWFDENGYQPVDDPQAHQQAQQQAQGAAQGYDAATIGAHALQGLSLPGYTDVYNRDALNQAFQQKQFSGDPNINTAEFLKSLGGIAQGVQMISPDKIRLPDGEIVDVARDVNAQGVGGAWWGSERDWTPAAGQGMPGGGGGGPAPQMTAYDNGPGAWGGQAPGQSPGQSLSGLNLPPMPTAPQVQNLTAPNPFTYQPNTQGAFNAPSQTPQMERLTYNPATAPQSLTAQQVQTPQNLTYNPMATPTAFQGNRQATPATLSYASLATPEGYQAERYEGLTAEQLKADPSYQFRYQQGADALENSAASKGTLRTGNTAKALIDYGQNAASQEYAAADARARSTNTMNNATSLGAYQTNAQTGLAYNQNANQNALSFGQANISNAFNANEANYGRGFNEAQQGFQNQFAVNQANNQGQFQAGQANILNQLNATQANNASNLAYGAQNFNQGFAVNQANNAGQQAAAQGNNANALAAQNQQFGQAATAYGLNQGAQNQAYQQALGAYGLNAQTQLGYGSQNQQNALANYQAQTNAALGVGNLNLGYQQAANSYALGQGSLGVQQGQLGLQQQGQQFNQGLDIYDRNYRANVTDPWNQNYQMASLGNPGAPNGQAYANAQSGLLTDQGNANAAGQMGGANAWNQSLGTIGNAASQLAYWEWLQQQP